MSIFRSSKKIVDSFGILNLKDLKFGDSIEIHLVSVLFFTSVFCFWFLLFLFQIVGILISFFWLHLILLPIVVLFYFPVIPTTIAVHYRRPKMAFFFGKRRYLKFRFNPTSGGFYYAYLATMKIADEKVKQENLEWLLVQFSKKTKSLYSGHIIMYCIINAQLNKNAKLSTALQRLRWLPPTSIPKKIGELAYKYALAEALTTDNTHELLLITQQWRDKKKSAAAVYVQKSHVALLDGRRIDSLSFELARRKADLPKALAAWLKEKFQKTSSKTHVSEMKLPSLLTTLQQIGTSSQSQNNQQTNALIAELTSPTKHQHWQKRAAELGVWNFQTIWTDYENQVTDMQASDKNDSRIIDETRFDKIDQAHKSLKYLNQSILQSIDKNKQIKNANSSIEHLNMWFQVLDQMEQLSTDKQAVKTAFANNYKTLWSWVVWLWNYTEDFRLAYFIVTWCRPYAQENGYTDFSKVIESVRKPRGF